MAEENDSSDESQKTEAPSERKLEDARKRGQVVYSREVTTWMGLFIATVLVVLNGPSLFENLRQTLLQFIEMPHAIPADGVGIKNVLRDLCFSVAKVLALPFLFLIIGNVLAGFIQTGPIFSFDPIMPDLSKISLRAGLGRLFSMKSIAEFIKGIIKLLVVSVAVYFAITPYLDSVDHFVGLDLHQSLFDFRDIFLRMMLTILSILFVVAILDYIYQRYSFYQQTRMTKQEVKEEFRQSEGDPHVKARLRDLREKKARQRMMQAVPKADVVITNPTHYAVALKYDTKEMDAPMMVAKGTDKVAQKIKEVAKENKVPIVENAPLARALFDSMEIDQIIPRDHWKAVAEVISYVFKLKNRRI